MPLSGLREGFSVTAIAVAQKVSRGGIPRKGIPKLLSCPFCGGVGRDATVQDAATIMGKHEENKQQPKGRSWHHEEISGNQLLHVILQECLPGLGRGPTGMDHVLGYSGFAMSMPSFRSSPRIRGAPRPGLVKLIFRMRSQTSRGLQGRPWRTRLFQVQYRRNPLRGSTKSRLLVERLGRKCANPSIGETTKPRRFGRQFASEAGDRGRSVRAPEADDARPKSRLAGQHGSVPSLAGKKTRADRGST